MTLIIILAILTFGFAYAIPIIPVTYTESYEVEVPYSSLESKQKTLGQTSDRTLEGGYYLHWSSYVSVGNDIEFSVSASDTVYLIIFSSSQYTNYLNTGNIDPNEKESLEISSGKIGYHVSSSGEYYFCLLNPHDGFLGIGDKSVGIYSAKIISYWQEEVSKTRLETHTREISEKVTILEYLSGDNVPSQE